MDVLILVAVLCTSAILLASGAGHVARPARFRSRMRGHQVLGPRGVRSAAAVLPVLEVLAAAAAVAAVVAPDRAALVAALAVQTALFGSFAGYLVAVVRAGRAGVPCGCGPAEIPVGRSATARAAGLGVLSCAALAGAAGPGTVALRADARGALAVAAGATFALLLVILPAARRREPSVTPGDGSTLDPAPARTRPERLTIGTA